MAEAIEKAVSAEAEVKPAKKKAAPKKAAEAGAAVKKAPAKKAAAEKAPAEKKAAKAAPAAKKAPAKKAAVSSLTVKLVKSLAGRTQKQLACAAALGLNKIGDVKVQPDNAATLGKIAKISHMVEVTKA